VDLETSEFYISIIGTILGTMLVCYALFTVYRSKKKPEIQKVEQADNSLGAIINSEIINNAKEAIITIDEHGEVVDFNVAAQLLFGYSYEEVVGSNIAEKIIPAELKDKHRSGLENYLTAGSHPLINQRNEVVAINSKGERIDVEITIIPISANEHIFFTAFIKTTAK
jgi:PAS domain S-box-containing protein